ncbi:small nuclear riboprotein [Capsaspora owczarzaki ATCC 30864]|uniref:Small nuclear riboprotein n=1 Tax=Capsaspora owczarzaki (strain ATCC 30864) TaxID=595528 RepID=A0A0D2U3I9_CAPO3|nr:small nuclear riboprotein [Capsaspora owczarzaki ATCC 30864]KJE89791.1 small nuclear riboprotein [Capsaspora owczarzaki ATCC 30864]|eukprot:XP_004349712.2 small nuclear riboprotein [Capsaspora owczarzaki ATCC 30864]
MSSKSDDKKKPKESIVNLAKLLDKTVRVKFRGGREVIGLLKGYDPLLNLVLDETQEFLRDPADPERILDETRALGLTVCRGTTVILICPNDGMEQIENPFLQEDGDQA